MEDKIKKLKNHVIVCGFGNNGRECVRILNKNKIPFVVIEDKHDFDDSFGIEVAHFLKGDATKDEVLLKAGIKKASCLITTLPIDAENLFVVLSAKTLNEELKIISRASNESAMQKIKFAGADNVIVPEKIGGIHMASLVLLPDVVEMVTIMTTKNNDEFKMVELTATRDVNLGVLNLWQKTNCTILGVKSKNLGYVLNPNSDFELKSDDRVVVMGSTLNLEAAQAIL